jgi:predicted ABC-type ATPase
MLHPNPTLWLIAGPNGAGKTTYAFRHIRAVSGSVRFVNLDEIARGLSPLDPSAVPRTAARVALQRIDDLIGEQQSFSIETTLAGLTHLRTIEAARANGYGINLLYFSVRDVETCRARIARRVSEGGHDVPEPDVRRRFTRSLANFPRYAAAVDLWRVFDNENHKPTVAAEGRRGCVSVMNDMSRLPPALATQIAAMAPCPEV